MPIGCLKLDGFDLVVWFGTKVLNGTSQIFLDVCMWDLGVDANKVHHCARLIPP